LNKEKEVTKIYNQSIGDIFIKMKDSSFELLDDLLQHKYHKDVFFKNNRSFYIGIFFILIAIVIQLIHMIANIGNQISKDKSNVIELIIK